MRLYVLVTSLDPLKLYVYEDGLVRIATEEYTEEEDKITDCCIHVTNFAVNRNNDKFVFNNSPSECHGNKVVNNKKRSTNGWPHKLWCSCTKAWFDVSTPFSPLSGD